MRRELLDHHRDLLAASAISDEVAAERGYWTATRKAELETLGFKRAQCSVPALVIPIRDAAGRMVNYQIRPDQPRIGDNGKPVKYESPAGIPPTLDVPPRCQLPLRSPHSALWITEGARKADAAASAGLCCVSLPGVWSWARRLNGDARAVLPDMQRIRLEDRKVVVAFDSDAMVKPAVHKALEALGGYLHSQGALVKFLYLPELEPGAKTGLDDFLAAGHTVEELWRHVEDELRPPPEPKQKRKPALPTAMLLGAVETLLRRYVHFPDEHGSRAVALFALHSWVIDAFDCTPYLYVTSPQKRSGKSRLEEVLELVCRSPLRAASITEAALFQAVEAMKPTLLIDEVDAIFTSRSERAEALRGVLNAGNRRGSKVVRGTQEGAPVTFETFCPKVLAGLDVGKMPDTIRDRAIVVRLERRKRGEKVERFKVRDITGQVEELRARLEDWAAADTEPLAGYRCEPMPSISERLEEGWEPLLAIAELAGGKWPERARAAALALANGAEDAGEDHGQQLVAALKEIFVAREAMSTATICEELNQDDELPFGGYRRGEGIDGRRLAKMLKPYGIKSKNIKLDGKVPKGYAREQFTEVWERYAPESEDARAQVAADDALPALLRYRGSENGSGEPKMGVADSELLSATYPLPPDSAAQSQNGDPGSGVAEVADEVQPPARTHTNGAGWTPEAADEFVQRAKETFPGSMELPLDEEADR